MQPKIEKILSKTHNYVWCYSSQPQFDIFKSRQMIRDLFKSTLVRKKHIS